MKGCLVFIAETAAIILIVIGLRTVIGPEKCDAFNAQIQSFFDLHAKTIVTGMFVFVAAMAAWIIPMAWREARKQG